MPIMINVHIMIIYNLYYKVELNIINYNIHIRGVLNLKKYKDHINHPKNKIITHNYH